MKDSILHDHKAVFEHMTEKYQDLIEQLKNTIESLEGVFKVTKKNAKEKDEIGFENVLETILDAVYAEEKIRTLRLGAMNCLSSVPNDVKDRIRKNEMDKKKQFYLMVKMNDLLEDKLTLDRDSQEEVAEKIISELKESKKDGKSLKSVIEDLLKALD